MQSILKLVNLSGIEPLRKKIRQYAFWLTLDTTFKISLKAWYNKKKWS